MTPALTPHFTPSASVTPTPNGWRLSIPAGPRGQYRLAQLDDYAHLPRSAFPRSPPFTLSLHARASATDLPGTWGFGLWNDPFGFALGFGGTARRLPALPNTAWFFHASPENYLSLLNDPSTPFVPRASAARRCETAGSGQAAPPNGFFAGTFRSLRWPAPLLAPALLALPFLALRPVSRLLRRLASQIVHQDGSAVGVDVTQWHEYSIRWHGDIVFFAVDGAEILRTPLAPHGPLGLVLWIDNQYAAWRPDGRLGYGTVANPAAWLEIENIVSD